MGTKSPATIVVRISENDAPPVDICGHCPGQESREQIRGARSVLIQCCAIFVILALSVSLVSCFRPATPDDDLLSAILLGDAEGVQQAIDRGANVRRVYQDGTSPLILACRPTKNFRGEAGADLSIAVKADLKKSDTSLDVGVQDTSLAYSSQTRQGNPEIVKLLLAKGAEVNVKDKEGRTALSLALRNNMVEIAAILREAGAKE